MIFRYPDYYEKFHCIADKCRDSCCIGWEIDIDRTTAGFYNTVGGGFGERLRKNISDGSFVLDENERCPFLNSRNLCDIYTELGEENLCQICSDHPRYFEWFGNVKEGGIGLCCEEAARLILTEDHVLKAVEIADEEREECDSEMYDILLRARDEMISCLSGTSLREGICSILGYAEILQERLDNGIFSLPESIIPASGKAADIAGVLEFFAGLEPIDPENPERLRNSKKYAGKKISISADEETLLKRLGVYFIYRYFMKGVFDGDIISRTKLAAVMVWLIAYLWNCRKYEKGSCGFDDCLWLAKGVSKEIEYCEENIEAFLDASYEPLFSSDAIAGLFELSQLM